MSVRASATRRVTIILVTMALASLVVISFIGTDRATAATAGSHLSASSTVVGVLTLQAVSSGSGFLAIGPSIRLTASSTGATSMHSVGSDGSFEIDDLEPGEYEVLAVAPGFVSRRIASIDLAEGSTDLGTVPLRAGLVNGDDIVDTLDISAIAASFGDSVGDRTDSQGRIVDMNGDGIGNCFKLWRDESSGVACVADP